MINISLGWCPVEECKEKISSVFNFRHHWKTIHVPETIYCLCPNYKECAFVSVTPAKLKLHFEMMHRDKDDRMLRKPFPLALKIPHKWPVYNQLYIDPGKYRLEGHESLNKGAGVDLKYLPSDTIKCPVITCDGLKLENKEEFSIHWEKCHVPVFLFYHCSYWDCSAVFQCAHHLKQHYQMKHDYNGNKLFDALCKSILHESYNLGYINPGPYRLRKPQGYVTCDNHKVAADMKNKDFIVPGTVTFTDVLKDFTRKNKPDPVIILIRGLPGSGKTHLAKYMKVREKNIKLTYD